MRVTRGLGVHVIPVIVTCTLQGMFCDMGIPRTFYGGKICSVARDINWEKILFVTKDFFSCFTSKLCYKFGYCLGQ